MIRSKSSLEQRLIQEYRDCFSQTLTGNQSFKTEEMKIVMDHTKEKAKNAYNFRPRAIPENIREKAREMIEGMLRAGVIKRATGPSDYCAQSSFVAKKNRASLRFVVDYTGLNKQILRPVHLFPSSQMMRNAIKPDRRVLGVLDFIQGYHQMSLAPESQTH